MRVTVSDEQIRSAFELVKDDPAFSESVQAMKRGQRPGEMLQALALRPDILHGFTVISSGHYPGGIVERDLKELFDRLRKHFTDAEIVEVTFLIGFINCLNLFNNLLRVTYQAEYEAHCP